MDAGRGPAKETKLLGGSTLQGLPCLMSFNYLQEPLQVLIVRIGEKSPPATRRGRGKVPVLKWPEFMFSLTNVHL